MHIEYLLTEVRALSDQFFPMDPVGRQVRPDSAARWNSPSGILDVVLACHRICDISARIAKAGYWECDRELLEQIGAQCRFILYHINDMKLAEAMPLDKSG